VDSTRKIDYTVSNLKLQKLAWEAERSEALAQGDEVDEDEEYEPEEYEPLEEDDDDEVELEELEAGVLAGITRKGNELFITLH
jgi:hypothetical protein